MLTFKQYRLALQVFQAKRLRRDFRDLAAQPRYTPVGEFFFTEIYGPRDFSQRDAQARRLHQLIHLLPGVNLRDLESILELLDLTSQLDDHLAQLLEDHAVGLDFDEPTYNLFYRLADNYELRLRQLILVDDCLHNVFRLSRQPLLGLAIHRVRPLARLAGLQAMQQFLATGYDILSTVDSIDEFASTISTRERERLDRIYA
jgi:DNA-binding transcriptional MerR regulator